MARTITPQMLLDPNCNHPVQREAQALRAMRVCRDINHRVMEYCGGDINHRINERAAEARLRNWYMLVW